MAKKTAPPPAGTPALALEGDLDLFSIHAQWEQVQPHVAAENGLLELDLSGIGDIDLSGIQLLSAIDRDLKAKSGSLVLIGAKADWVPRFDLLGLASLFETKAP
jgi:ABC-type transporter Mla MlaB component